MAQADESTLLGCAIQWMALTGVVCHLALLPSNRKMSFRAFNENQRRQGMGLAPHASSSSLTRLLQRPAATPGGTGTGEPDTVRPEAATPGLNGGHEGYSEEPPSSPKSPRPKRVAAAPKMASAPKGPKRRKTVAELLGKTTSHKFDCDTQQFWKFGSGAATKAKSKITSIIGMWSPSRRRPLDPPLNDRMPILADQEQTAQVSEHPAIARRASVKDTLENLERDFASNTSRKAKAAIRTTINSVFKESKGLTPMPPTPEKVKLLGGILKAAKYKAANNYLGEYKLLAIELGHEWTSQLERTLKLTKRSAARASGPKTKAPEVAVNETGEVFAARDPMIAPRKVPLAGELFDFGVIWMLREIELAAVTKDHISLDFSPKRVKLTLPVSKGDQEGLEVKRVLQCVCEQRICDISCPFYVAVRLLDRMVALDLELACVTQKKKPATKAQLVTDWKRLFGESVTGHSARRAGALRLIRRGWSIPRVAHPGRWKSSVIYQYAAEALESLPVNTAPCTPAAPIQRGPTFEELENIKNYLLAELSLAKEDQRKATEMLDAEVEAMKARNTQHGDRLPPVVQAVASKIVHYNMDMASCSPPQVWRTLCGWHYHRSDFVFITKVDGLHLCRKCWDLAQSNRVKVGEMQLQEPDPRVPAEAAVASKKGSDARPAHSTHRAKA
eukprot:s2086_g15.t1